MVLSDIKTKVRIKDNSRVFAIEDILQNEETLCYEVVRLGNKRWGQ